MPNLPADTSAPRHTLTQAIALHLLPGLLTTGAYIVLAPIVMDRGYPAVFGLLLAAFFVIIPSEFGYLLYQAKRHNGTLSLQGIVLYREPIPFWQYLVFSFILLLWGFLISGAISPLDNLIGDAAFAWLPDWFFISSLDQFAVYSRGALMTTFLFGIVVNGFAGPIVEELYFRGYLLPRLSKFGRWAPLLNVVLFSLYHFWTPWQNLSRILLMLPLGYTVWWTKNIYVGIIAHCAINLIGWSLTFALVLGGAP